MEETRGLGGVREPKTTAREEPGDALLARVPNYWLFARGVESTRPASFQAQLWGCIFRSSGTKQTPVGREAAERGQRCVCALWELKSG